MISVVIPAHNEAAVIERCLRTLIDGVSPDELQVIVVCNGCSDDTAEIARAVPGPIRVIETPIASKTNAMNLGDDAAQGFPRVYMDADVIVSLASVRALAAYLSGSGRLAASPWVRYDLSGCSRAVYWFYEIDERLLAASPGIGGAGVYALSEAGRSRFQRFPEIIGDDAFVRRLFSRSEQGFVADAISAVRAPDRIGGLIKIKTRSHLGNYQLRRLRPDLWADEDWKHHAMLARLFLNPALFPKLFVYAYVKLAAKLRARWQLLTHPALAWERDETSRRGPMPDRSIAHSRSS